MVSYYKRGSRKGAAKTGTLVALVMLTIYCLANDVPWYGKSIVQLPYHTI